MQLPYRSTVGFSYEVSVGMATLFCGVFDAFGDPLPDGHGSDRSSARRQAVPGQHRILRVTELESDSLEDLEHGYG